MKARDGDTQLKKRNDGVAPRSGSSGGPCPSCKSFVPAKPGFRFSSLKCPKCGVLMGKK